MNISVVILSYNSSATIGATIESAKRVSNDIHVVDSFSADDTRQIIERSGARLVLHPFANYAAQRNWASTNLPLSHDWELHLDADERLSEELTMELCRLQAQSGPLDISGYHIARLVHFLNRPILHGGMFPIWHLRLFRHGQGRCETREYDQHFVVNGATSRLHGLIIDDIKMSLSEWVIRHNRWSDAEVRELLQANSTAACEIVPRLFGSPIERKRYLRGIYYRLPLLLRAFALFVYRYIIRAGFLDGREGAVFFTLQAFCYRFLVDAKLYECGLTNRTARPQMPTPIPPFATTTGPNPIGNGMEGENPTDTDQADEQL